MNLDQKFKEFADLNYESIDEITDINFSKRKADYLLFERKWVLEVKYLKTDRALEVDNYINNLANNDPEFPQFFGTVHIENIIKSHKNSDEFRKKISDYAGRNLKDLVRSANQQIRDTKEALRESQAVGVLVLLNDNIDMYECDYVYQETARLLEKRNNGKIERESIQLIWFINENRTSNIKEVFSHVYYGPTADKESALSLMNFLQLDWIHHNGYAFYPNELGI